MSKDVTLNNRGLKKLMKSFESNAYIKVGILGDKAVREGGQGELNNPSIGAIHEFGTSKVERRSFLRMPLTEELFKELKRSKAFDKETIEKIVEQEHLDDFLKNIAATAEGVVLDAFDTGGFGKWKPSNMTNKKIHQTLVETTELRESITAIVEEDVK